MESKKWYRSKMLWVNLIALAGIVYQLATGREVLVNAETQSLILALVNLVLRLVTRQGIEP